MGNPEWIIWQLFLGIWHQYTSCHVTWSWLLKKVILYHWRGHLEPPFCCCWHSHSGCCPLLHHQVQADALHCNPVGKRIYNQKRNIMSLSMKSDAAEVECYSLTCLVNSKGFRQKTYRRAAANIPERPPHTVATVNSPVYMCRDSAKLTSTSVLHPAIGSCSAISHQSR